MTYLYAIVGALLYSGFLIFGGYHFGRLSVEEHEEKDLATQYQSELAKRVVAEGKLKAVTDAYDKLKDIPDPIVTGLAQRVRLIETACPVPSAPGASGTPAPSPQPRSDESAQRLLGLEQAVYNACAADAQQLNALVQAHVAILP